MHSIPKTPKKSFAHSPPDDDSINFIFVFVFSAIRKLTESCSAFHRFFSFYFSYRDRDAQLNACDFITNWHCFNTRPTDAADICDQLGSHHTQPMNNGNQMESKAYRMVGGRSQSKPHTGLLRRRHSLPEIIMRK